VVARLAANLGGTVRTLYYGLRAAATRRMDAIGPRVNRPTPGRVQDVFREGSAMCHYWPDSG
jgi:hypothetical protein